MLGRARHVLLLAAQSLAQRCQGYKRSARWKLIVRP